MTLIKPFILFLLLGLFSCGAKKEAVKNTSVDKVVIDSLIITKVPDATMPPPPHSISEESESVILDTGEIRLPPVPQKPNNERNDANHIRWNKLLQEFVSESGKVDYLGFKSSSEFDVYIDWLLEHKPDDTWSREEQLAYWINAYNALTVDLILRNYPIKSIKDIKDPWGQRLWKFDDKWLNLNDIEHKILRKMNEPRIHFAIVCASTSCPKLQNKAFTGTNLETMLTKSTKAFLSDTSKNEITPNSLKLSKIFKWFAKDFKQDESLIDFLNRYSNVKISENASKSFKNYNWDLNE
ncbi:DUF547 domain-containing protein [Winogradskyella alexanderae]|uniref:DUF547 domain-containing protein n=1 Tax=Winogradskyella alexanderae TaxID=2877123 RepID=A0ABS7XUN4_9FLAO|nr:DUF547 domain-containing protein [Winogradskyella alexanderae]MCA0132536.1 DUF547 domain-containing protein [Winogradskyella alexanderae]